MGAEARIRTNVSRCPAGRVEFFFFNDPATTEIYTSIDTLSLHDALPILVTANTSLRARDIDYLLRQSEAATLRSEEHTSELQSPIDSSYAVFGLKKKKAGVLPVPRIDDGAVGRPGVDDVHRRHRDRRGAGPQLPSPVFFFNDTATTEIYTSIDTLSLHDALPI